jgi:hypothetical protein
VALAMAASILAGMMIFESWTPQPERIVSQDHQDAVSPQLVALLNEPIGALLDSARPIQQRLVEARYGYLDRDAARLGRFVIGQLDVLPASAKASAPDSHGL